MTSSTLCLTLLPLLCATASTLRAADDFPAKPQVPFLSPEEELKTIELPDGYKLELVLSEPIIKEPVAAVFDGNGRMYVSEFLSYMQDIDGNHELEPVSRISRHESTKGDGVFDKHSIYLDKQLLPRLVMPLDDRVVVGLTNTSDLITYRDTNGDGVADQSVPFYTAGARGGNLEHQPSGLVWGLDNWIYTTYNSYRLRYNPNGLATQEPTAPNGGQWGLAQDDHGKMWWSNAGGEKGLWNYQVPIVYGAINVPSQKPDDFDTVWPLVGVSDFQGGPGKARPEDGTLNHFTGCAGQTVFRGDRLPAELRGNVFLPEPVGRLIRRTVVEMKDGVTTVSNPHGHSEFLRSRDLNFRPLNMTTGPDGCLYIVDMYRGIIQEGNWVREGSYLRKVVKQYGFQNNVGRGRIWRLVHKDFKPGPQPHMLDETPAQLVAHLTHPNGWWRDTAQRMLVVKGDKSVVPALQTLFTNCPNYLGKIHALWTLEGLGALTPELVRSGLKDTHPQVRVQTIRAAETLLKAGEASLTADIAALQMDASPDVVLQVVMTGNVLKFPDWKTTAASIVLTSASKGVQEIGKQLLTEDAKIAGNFSPQERKQLLHGQQIFRELCFACHGPDGKGTPLPGVADKTLAPPLSGSQTVQQGDAIIRVILHGLAGPVNGRTYEAQMVALGNSDDAWIADVASYVRNSFGNAAPIIDKKDVTKLRKSLKDRTTPWTIAELQDYLPRKVEARSQWKLTASRSPDKAGLSTDDKAQTRWDTGQAQEPGQWFQVELPQETSFNGIELDSNGSANDYPRGYKVELSADGQTWSKPVAEGTGTRGTTTISLTTPAKAKFIRITQTGKQPGTFWSIHELNLLQPPVKS